jgi:hypothetical protein
MQEAMHRYTYPVLVESYTLTDICVRQDQWWRTQRHASLQRLQCIADAFQFGGN